MIALDAAAALIAMVSTKSTTRAPRGMKAHPSPNAAAVAAIPTSPFEEPPDRLVGS